MTENGAAAPRLRSPAEFDEVYSRTPPWDIGRPQPEFLRLAESGAITGRVLDVGCGTGEHVLMVASRGLDATGIDAAPTAIAMAQRKARERGLSVRLLTWDALELPSLGEQFDTIIDCGLFHIFDDAPRSRFVRSLRASLRPGGCYHMLCISEQQPGSLGPRRVTQEEICASFRDGWQIESIRPASIDLTIRSDGARAWLSAIRRV